MLRKKKETEFIRIAQCTLYQGKCSSSYLRIRTLVLGAILNRKKEQTTTTIVVNLDDKEQAPKNFNKLFLRKNNDFETRSSMCIFSKNEGYVIYAKSE